MVYEPDETFPALEKAKRMLVQFRVPAIVAVMLERVTNVSIGTSITEVAECEDLAANDEASTSALFATSD